MISSAAPIKSEIRTGLIVDFEEELAGRIIEIVIAILPDWA